MRTSRQIAGVVVAGVVVGCPADQTMCSRPHEAVTAVSQPEPTWPAQDPQLNGWATRVRSCAFVGGQFIRVSWSTVSGDTYECRDRQTSQVLGF